MSHLDYYKYQATARGIHSLQDVIHTARDKAFLYDRIVLPWLPANKDLPIAELACGHGSFLWWLKERQFTRLTGVDSSPEQIAFARQVGANVFPQDINAWLSEQPEASQQIIFAIDLIEHISKDDMMALLKAAYRVLAKGGRLILRFPNGDSPLVGMNLFNDITHVWTYTPNCLDTLARMHGFTATRFLDEGCAAIRDHRWLKVPLCKFSQAVLGFLFRAASKEKIVYWSPHLWACLET
jgi:cyclopropane fatty-acyl-phospholipid synthase-like methyltransferase